MKTKTFWNRALIISVLFHLGAIPCLGIILNGYLLAPAPNKKHIELELVSLVSANSLDNGQAAGQKKQISQPQNSAQKSFAPDNKSAPIAKEDAPVIAKTIQSNANHSGEKSIDNISGQTQISSLSRSGDSLSNGGEQSAQAAEYISPQLLNKIEPVYPEKAKSSSREGTVAVRLEVLDNGQVGNVTLRQSSGHADLDDAAVKAVKKWRFAPAKNSLNGQPVTCFVNFSIVFRLK